MAKLSGFIARLSAYGCLLLLSSLVDPASGQDVNATSSTVTLGEPATNNANSSNSNTPVPGLLPPSSSVTVIITTPPANLTVASGGNVTFDCGIGDNEYSGTFIWQTYRGTTLGGGSALQIYSMNTPSNIAIPSLAFSSPYNKYTQSNTYGLQIKGVDLMDGARYGCNYVVGDVTATATLVVIDSLEANFVEPENQDTDMDNDTVVSPGKLQCTVRFGAPTFYDQQIRANRMPRLRMTFDGVTYSANSSSGSSIFDPTVQVVYEQGSPRETPHSLVLTVNRNLTLNDVGKEMFCYVSTADPAYEDMTSIQYTADSWKPWDLLVELPETYPDGVMYVDDIVNCSSEHHPNAIIHWVPLDSPHKGLVDMTSLVITEEMIGYNVWECVAYNTRLQRKSWQRIAFNVTENPDNFDQDTSEEDEARRRVALGVGLGLGLGIPIVTILIVVIVLLLKRRKSGRQPIKNGKPAAGAASGYAPLSAQSDQVPPPIYQPKTNAPAPTRTRSPVPSEEPSLINQSGHGDLGGLGLKPASLPSRSNSNVNSSIGERPLLPPGNRPSSVQPGAGFADIGGGLGSRAPYAESQDSTSAVSVPHSVSMRSEASSVNMNRSGGPTYRTPAPRSGHATGV